MRLHILHPTAPRETRATTLPANNERAAVLALVEPIIGGKVKHAPALLNGARADMFTAAEDADLPRNEDATAVLRAAWVSQRGHEDPERMPHVRGVAVVIEGGVW